MSNNFRNYKFTPGQNDAKRQDFKKYEITKRNLECTYCHGTNHTKDRCYHLIGFPPRKPIVNSGTEKIVAQMSATGQAINHSDTKTLDVDHGSQTSDMNTTLSTAQYQQLLQLLNQNTISSSPSEMPQSGKFYHTCS